MDLTRYSAGMAVPAARGVRRPMEPSNISESDSTRYSSSRVLDAASSVPNVSCGLQVARATTFMATEMVCVKVDPGRKLSQERATEILSAAAESAWWQTATCDYDHVAQIFHIRTAAANIDDCLLDISSSIREDIEPPSQAGDLPDRRETMPGADDYEYDPRVLAWNPHDLGPHEIPAYLAALTYRWDDDARRIWFSSNARDDSTSIFHLSNKGALTVLAGLSGLYLETNAEARTIVVCGNVSDEELASVKQMLTNFEQHLALKPKCVIACLLAGKLPPHQELQFVDDIACLQSGIQPGGILPEQVDNRLVLRAVGQGAQTLDVETDTAVLNNMLKFIPGKRTYALSMIWNSYVFLAKVDQSPVSTSTTVRPATPLLEAPTTSGSGTAENQTATPVEEWIVANTGELNLAESNRVSEQALVLLPTSQHSSTTAKPLSEKSGSTEQPIRVRVTVRRPIHLGKKPASNEETPRPKPSRDLDELIGASVRMNLVDNEESSDDGLDEFFDAPESSVDAYETSEHQSEGEGSEQSMDISTNSSAKGVGSAKGSSTNDFGSAKESTMKNGGSVTGSSTNDFGSAKESATKDGGIVKESTMNEFGSVQESTIKNAGSAKESVKMADAESERLAGPDIQLFIPGHNFARASEDSDEEPSEFDESEHLYHAVREILKLSGSHHGDVGWRIRLGRVLSSVHGSFDRYPFAAKHFDEVIAKLFKGQPTFTNLLRLSQGEADILLDLETDKCVPVFNARPETLSVTYEFDCVDENGKDLLVHVDAVTFKTTAMRPSRTLGAIYCFFPTNSWDVQLLLTGRNIAYAATKAVKSLVSSLYIPPGQTEASLVLQAPPGLEVRGVVVKRRTQHMVLEPLSFESDAAMALQLTEVQNLIVKRSPASDVCVLRAFAKPPAEMVADPQGCRLWYEAELVPLGLNRGLKAMGSDRFFAKSPDDTADVSPAAVADLYHVVTNVVAALDQLGAHAPAADGLAAFTVSAPTMDSSVSASDASLHSCASSEVADGVHPTTGPGDQEEYW